MEIDAFKITEPKKMYLVWSAWLLGL